MEVVPWVSSRSGGAAGAAWCLAGSEVPGSGDAGAKNIVWPLPLALASAVDGEGVAVFGGEGVLASALFSGGVPLFCRCSLAEAPPTDEDLEKGLFDQIQNLLTDHHLLAQMSQAMKSLASPGAAQKIADLIYEMAGITNGGISA